MFRNVRLGMWATCVLLTMQVGVANAGPADVVLYASDAVNLHGNWARVPDATAAGGQMMSSADRGGAWTGSPQAAPADYFDFTFVAPADTNYHIWIRLRAAANSKYNDSLFAQFSDSRDSTGAAVFGLGSTSGLTVNLATDGSGQSLKSWGWEDGAYWLAQAATITFATTGTHTLRIQTREDGLQIDQVVLSASRYLTSAPGPASNDTTIVPKVVVPMPYAGAIALPGTVLAENFDNGGEGAAYHDTSANNAGGVYRSTDVDIQASSVGGYNIGWTADGEWLAYTINVTTGGLYLLEFQVASPAAVSQMHASFGSADTASVSIPNTGGWQNWTRVGVTANLAAGPQLMKVIFDVGGFNFAGVTATFIPPPAMPVVQTPTNGVTGVATATTLGWSTAGAMSYDVRFGPTNPPATAATGLSSASYALSGLTNETTYFWQVIAHNDGGSTAGPISSFTTIVAPPAMPAVQTPASGATGIATAPTLSWSATGATSYDVRFGPTNSPVTAATGLASASYALSGLTNETTYFWQVIAHNVGGTTEGPVSSFTTIVAPPAMPVVLTPASGAAEIAIAPTLSWSATGATSYDVRFGSTHPPATAATGLSSASYALSGLTNETTYFWQVIAHNVGGTTEGSVSSFTTIVAPPAVPVVQTPASGETGIATAPTLSWSAAGATSYDVRFGPTNEPVTGATGLASASYALSGLTNETTYFWQVIAHNVGGTTEGPVSSFTTIVAPPAMPVVLTPESGAAGIAIAPTLLWSAMGATSYDVRFGATNPPAITAATGLVNSSYSPSGLINDTTYFWQVIARNEGGTTEGPISSFRTIDSWPSTPSEIVIYAGDVPASALHGSWRVDHGPSSPTAIKLVTPDNGVTNVNNPLASPTDYVDATFNAPAGTPYRVWMRLAAQGNSKYNDSLWLQFSDALTNGSSIYPIGTTAGLLVNLATDAGAMSINGWGWQNTAYWLWQPTTVSFATSGKHTVRVQIREDGVQFDQIVLSPVTHSKAAPGPFSLDSTIVPKPPALPPPSAPTLPSPASLATNVGMTRTLGWTSAGATSYDVRYGTVNPPQQAAANITVSTYAPQASAAGTTYFWQIVARNAGGSTTGAVWSFETALPPPPQPPPSSVPTAYNAITDRGVYAKPALPLLGPAGSILNDPAFGSRMLRVTDDSTRPGAPARSYSTPSASHQSAWNTNSRYFYLRSTDGTYVPYAFDPATMSASRIAASSTGDGGLTIYSNTEPQFSYVSPNILYGTRQDPDNHWPILRQFDFSTGSYTDLLNLGSAAPLAQHSYAGGLASSASAPERVLAFLGGSQQDRHYLAMVFTLGQVSVATVDTLASTVTVDGTTIPTGIRLDFHLHHALIDKSGRYVILETTSADRRAPRFAAPKYVWDTATNVFTALPEIAALSGGHYSAGFGTMINHDCCTATTWDAGQWQMRSLATPTTTSDVIKTVVTPREIYLDDHSSWNNATPDTLVPVISALYRYGANTTTWRPWDDEIVAVQTSAGAANATVWRFGHHRSNSANDIDPSKTWFWYSPRPNVSQDGRWAIFTSNWEKTLGIDPLGQPWGGMFRGDVFLVELAPKP